MKKKYPLGPYGLSIILMILFVFSWAIQTYTGWLSYKIEQGSSDGYLWHWLAQTMENWQSEFLQLLTFVILTAHFIHIGSHESRDRDDETSEVLDKISEDIKQIKESVASHAI